MCYTRVCIGNNVEDTISDEIVGATRRLLANQERVAALEEKVSQIQLLLSSNLQHTFTGTSFVGPDNIPNEMQSKHHVSPQRQATPVSPQRSDGHSHATLLRADSIDGQKQIIRAEPDAGQGQVIRDGPDANDVLPMEDTVVRADPDAGQGQVICDMAHATEPMSMEVTATRAEPDAEQGQVICDMPHATEVVPMEVTAIRLSLMLSRGKSFVTCPMLLKLCPWRLLRLGLSLTLCKGRSFLIGPMIPMLSRWRALRSRLSLMSWKGRSVLIGMSLSCRLLTMAKSIELSHLHIIKIAGVFILVISVKKWIADVVVVRNYNG